MLLSTMTVFGALSLTTLPVKTFPLVLNPSFCGFFFLSLFLPSSNFLDESSVLCEVWVLVSDKETLDGAVGDFLISAILVDFFVRLLII